jgi:WD40 repeat protein
MAHAGVLFAKKGLCCALTVKAEGSSDQLETLASAPAAKRASEGPRTAESRSTIGPQLRDPKRYHVMGEHGRGGLGRVQRALDRELGRDVAIKELISRNEVHEVRFLREALITAKLEHPGIVPVHEAGRWPDGTPFYAMKLVSGRSLRDLIAECKTSDERLGLLHHVIAVADAIAYAHGRNIIHRDLKPANVIVGDFGETVVIDWGLAKDLTASEEPIAAGDPSQNGGSPSDDELTVEGSVLGTPAYMAPEQGRGEAVDQRADVFAIGTMLWELCAARRMPPASAEARHRILRRAGIDRDLITIIDNALHPDREKRYHDAGALAADLKAFKSGFRIAARDYSLWATLAHWIRRHKSLATAIGAAVLIAVGGTVIYVRNIAIERDRADTALVTAQQERDRAKLSEASLVLDKDPNRASALLHSLPMTPQVALLTSRANQLSATRILPTAAGVDGMFRARGAKTVELITAGELVRLDPASGTLTPLDRDLTRAFAYRGGEPIYARQPFGTRGIRIATPSNINALKAGALDNASQLVALDDTTYVLDAAGDLHLLDGKAASVVNHGVHRIAGSGNLLLVCYNNGELDVERGGVVVQRRRCAQTKTAGAMTVVHGDYAALTDDGTLLTSRNGRPLELPTEILGEYEMAQSERGVIAIVDYLAKGKTWYVGPNGTRLEPGPTRGSQPYSVAADGDLVAWGYIDGTVIVLDVTTAMSWELHGHAEPVGYVVLDAEAKRVVTASRREVRVWSIKPPPTALVTAMPCSIFSVEPSLDGQRVALDCNDGSVRVWSRSTGAVAQIQKHVGYSYGVQWVRDRVCSGGWGDGRVQCSNADGSKLEMLDTRTETASWMSAPPDQQALIFASLDGKVWRFDGTMRELYAHGARPNKTAVSGDGKLLASCAQDGSLAVYDLAKARRLALLFAHTGPFCHVAWEGEVLWSAGAEGTIKHWAFREGQLTLDNVVQVPGALRLVKVAHGTWVAAAGAGTLLVSQDGQTIAIRLDTGGTIEALDISPDLRFVAASVDGEILVIDLRARAISTTAIRAAVKQIDFLEPGLLVFSEPTALKTLKVTDLTYVPFDPN